MSTSAEPRLVRGHPALPLLQVLADIATRIEHELTQDPPPGEPPPKKPIAAGLNPAAIEEGR